MLAILQFDEEFRGMVARGEATYDNHSSLNDLQAHHIDSPAVKCSLTAGHEIAEAPAQASFSLAARSLLVDIAISGTRIPITLRGAITLTRVSYTIHGAVFHRSQPSPGEKNRLPIDHILLLRQLS